MSYASMKFRRTVARDDDGVVTMTILDTDVHRLVTVLNGLNDHAERVGMDDRFTYDLGLPDKKPLLSESGKVMGYHDVVRVYVQPPQITAPGWEVCASLDFTDAGTIVRTVPGHDLSGWERPDKRWCDHCDTKRNRVRSFAVRCTDTGEIRQVGSSCLRKYTGIDPKTALSMINWETAVRKGWSGITDEDGNEDTEFTIASGAYHPSWVIRLAYVLSDGGKNFVSKTAARRSNGTLSATSDLVENEVISPGNCSTSEVYRAAEQVSDTIVDEIMDFGRGLSGNSDYVRNVRTLMDSTAVNPHLHLGYLSSVVGLWHRETHKAPAPEPIKRTGHVGAIKERLRNMSLTVERVSYTQGMYGTTTILAMHDSDDHLITWFASNLAEDVEVGDQIVLDGTVRAHTQFRGDDQTTLTRCRVHEIIQSTAAAA